MSDNEKDKEQFSFVSSNPPHICTVFTSLARMKLRWLLLVAVCDLVLS